MIDKGMWGDLAWKYNPLSRKRQSLNVDVSEEFVFIINGAIRKCRIETKKRHTVHWQLSDKIIMRTVTNFNAKRENERKIQTRHLIFELQQNSKL